MIEDIEYLNKHCEKDSTPIYVDSAHRDMNFFPTPSEYVVQFNQPFKLVNGIEILDASIPTTMYNIDNYNNKLAITQLKLAPSVNDERERLFTELADCFIFRNIFEVALETSLLIGSNDTFDSVNRSTWTAMSNDDVVDTEFFAVVRSFTTNIPITIVTKTSDSSLYVFTYKKNKYGIPNTSDNAGIITALEAGNTTLSMNTNTNLMEIVSFEFYKIPKLDYQNMYNLSQYTVLLKNFYKALEIGNYDITTLRNKLNEDWYSYGFSIDPTTPLDRKQGKLVFRSSDWFLINARKSTIGDDLGFSTFPTDSEASLYEKMVVGDNNKIFVGKFNNDDNMYTIYAPGIVNLLGERFLILRCKEIESHLLGSFAYGESTPGIGLFKLAASYNDVTHLRFDFVSLVRKPFHPIGKLTKLTFRFELSNGKLYDFKGINHQLLFVIKYLVPTQKVDFKASLLNPNYDANFMRYMSNNKSMQYKEDSDDEQEFDNQHNIDRYKKEIMKHDYDTTSDEDEDASYDFDDETDDSSEESADDDEDANDPDEDETDDK